MNRLQKKCLIAATASHGLLLVLLVVGPAFFVSPDKTDSHQTISVISGKVVDDALSSGGSPEPQITPPTPPPPAPVVVTPPPTPKAEPIKIPNPPKPVSVPVKESEPKQEKTPTAKSDEFKPTTRQVPKPAPNKPADTSAKQIADNQELIRRINKGVGRLSTALAKNTAVQINPGVDNGEQVTNYRDIVASTYTAAWVPPVSLEDDSATVTARVTIGRDGRVTSHQITKSSGNAAMDKSIENTLDNVTFIEPFPEGSKDAERTFSIKFNLAAKRSLG